MKNFCNTLFALCFSFISLSAPAQFVERQQLIGTGGITIQSQGKSIAISKDGTTAVVGGARDNDARGAIWVYVKSGNSWVQQGSKLTPNDISHYLPTGVFFGHSVAISGDGNTIIVGAPFDNNGFGAAWLFTRTGNTWSQQGSKIIPTGTNPFGSRFEIGKSVAISDDGNTVLIGAGQAGSVWVFNKSGNVLTQEDMLTITPSTFMTRHFGHTVSISGDGKIALIGNLKYRNFGTAHIYRKIGNNWTAESILQDSLSGYTEQGQMAKISGDGKTAAVVARGGMLSNTGLLNLYTYRGNAWLKDTSFVIQSIIAGYGSNQELDFSYRGDTLAIGCPMDNSHSGAVFLYFRSNGIWTQLSNKLVPTPNLQYSSFGISVALTGDGKSLFVGQTQRPYPSGKVIVYNDNLPYVNISSSAKSICTNTPVIFTATPINGGATPAFQWKKNGSNVGSNVGSNSATYTDNAIANGDVVTVEMTSSATGANPNPVTAPAITMSVTPAVVPTVSIASSGGTTISTGQSVTFTASPTHAGAAPVYRWLKNGAVIPGETSATYTTSTLADQDTISAVLFSSATCATPDSVASNKIGMRVVTGVAGALSSLNIKLYPNPVQQELTIATAAITAPLTITLIDATGRTLLQQVLTSGTSHSLSLSAVPAGVYIVSVQSKEQVQHYRVVKQ